MMKMMMMRMMMIMMKPIANSQSLGHASEAIWKAYLFLIILIMLNILIILFN